MQELTPQACAECGYEPERWRPRDASTLFGELGWWWRAALDDLPAAGLNRRPGEGVWSPLEYGQHLAEATASWRAAVEMIVAADGVEVPPVGVSSGAGANDPVILDPGSVSALVESEGHALGLVAQQTPASAWLRHGFSEGRTVAARAALDQAIHEATHHQLDVARGLRALGIGVVAHEGSVAQLNASQGGVPKLPVARATVSLRGVEGDVQNDRKHHGRPFQALCLWSAEVLDELAGLGHPIGPGCAGENLTVTGIDWPAMRPGVLMRIGSVLAELSFPAVPCAKQAQWFNDGDFRRIDHDVSPHWARWYAWVRRPGLIRPGDAVVVQPVS